MLTPNSNNLSIIGIDVSKDKLDIFILDSSKHKTIANNAKAISVFIKEIKKINSEMMIVLENTGGYEILARKIFNEAGIKVHVAHPTRVHYFAKQKGYFGKTDQIDAKIIAQYGMQEAVQASPELSAEEIALKELSARRGQLIDQITAEKCRLKPHLSKPVASSIKRQIKNLEGEIELIDEEINSSIKKDEDKHAKVAILQSFKGIGLLTANLIVCLLPELGNLNRAEIAALCGLAPKNKDSGIKSGRRMISGGRFYVRKALYMAALSTIKYNLKFKNFYLQLKLRGKNSKVAIVAVMRKMIIALNAMLRDGKIFVAG